MKVVLPHLPQNPTSPKHEMQNLLQCYVNTFSLQSQDAKGLCFSH